MLQSQEELEFEYLDFQIQKVFVNDSSESRNRFLGFAFCFGLLRVCGKEPE